MAWRDTARTLRIGPIDVRAFAPFVICAVHIKIWTFLLSLAGMAFFVFLDYKKWPLEVAIRKARSFLAGKLRSDKAWIDREKL